MLQLAFLPFLFQNILQRPSTPQAFFRCVRVHSFFCVGIPVSLSLHSHLLLRILRKCAWLLFVFLGITLVSFLVIHLAPGSPTDMEVTLNPLAGEAARKRLEALYGLDKSLTEQYLNWLVRLLHFDFGNSMSADARPVMTKILERLPLTVSMNVISLILTLLVAIPVGIFSACRQNSFWDHILTLFVFLGFAMPSFWLALLLMTWFGIDLQWLPISGLTAMNYDQMGSFDKFCDLAKHLTLPIMVYTLGSLAGMSRYMRSCMLEVLRQDYMTVAWAKGLSPFAVLVNHGLRNALLPVITLLGLSVPGLIGGSVIIESIFALPGLGNLFYAAVMARDYTMIMGNLVLGSILTLAGNLLADICYSLADPRIRTQAV
ncbi:MAG: ABC transporter permease [Desulfovibrio sp.]|nr:ABC transporter permease [Desulfovibrio sp.]